MCYGCQRDLRWFDCDDSVILWGMPKFSLLSRTTSPTSLSLVTAERLHLHMILMLLRKLSPPQAWVENRQRPGCLMQHRLLLRKQVVALQLTTPLKRRDPFNRMKLLHPIILRHQIGGQIWMASLSLIEYPNQMDLPSSKTLPRPLLVCSDMSIC
jgi:hypothetical protein